MILYSTTYSNTGLHGRRQKRRQKALRARSPPPPPRLAPAAQARTEQASSISCFTGFVRVMENLKSHEILETHFPGLESHGN